MQRSTEYRLTGRKWPFGKPPGVLGSLSPDISSAVLAVAFLRFGGEICYFERL